MSARVVGAGGRRDRSMHSIDFCTPNDPTRALRASSAPGVSFSPAQRRLRAALPSFTDFHRVRTEERAPKGSEPVDAIEARGIRVSRRGHPLRRPVSIGPAAFSSAAPLERPASDTSVASSASPRRPPRSVLRSPRERLTLPRSEVPSLGEHYLHTARTEARTGHVAFASRTALT